MVMVLFSRRVVVRALDWIDWLLDAVPSWERPLEGGRRRWYRHGGWGCRLRLAHAGAVLADRWGLDAWRPVTDADLAED
jgi:hypothetical protein